MEKSRSWSSAHDWKSCNRQKRFESSNLSFSAKTKSLDIKGKPFCIKAFLCLYVTCYFSNNNVFLRILVCFMWSMSHVSSSLSIGLFSVSLMNLYVNSVPLSVWIVLMGKGNSFTSIFRNLTVFSGVCSSKGLSH